VDKKSEGVIIQLNTLNHEDISTVLNSGYEGFFIHPCRNSSGLMLYISTAFEGNPFRENAIIQEFLKSD
jgi:hypothetical protein